MRLRKCLDNDSATPISRYEMTKGIFIRHPEMQEKRKLCISSDSPLLR